MPNVPNYKNPIVEREERLTWRNIEPHQPYKPYPSQKALEMATGLLASSPRYFSESYDIIQKTHSDFERDLGISGLQQDFSLTNYGIRICIPREPIDRSNNLYIAYLACENVRRNNIVAFFLQQRGNQYVRVLPGNLMKIPYSDIVFVKSSIVQDILHVKAYGWEGSSDESHLQSSRHFHLTASSIASCESYGFVIADHGPPLSWRRNMRTGAYTLLISPALCEDFGYILFLNEAKEEGFLLILAEITKDLPTMDICVSKPQQAQAEPEEQAPTTDGSQEETTEEEFTPPLVNICHRFYVFGQSADEAYSAWLNSGGRRVLSPMLRCTVVDLSEGRRVFISISGSSDKEKARYMPWEVSIRILNR